MGQLYADKEQMLKRYRAEDIADLTQDDETRLNAVLASTSALIDGYVAPRYRLPLQNKHDILTDARAARSLLNRSRAGLPMICGRRLKWVFQSE